MSEIRRYELTQEEVLEICQALKFHADALDRPRCHFPVCVSLLVGLFRERFSARSPQMPTPTIETNKSHEIAESFKFSWRHMRALPPNGGDMSGNHNRCRQPGRDRKSRYIPKRHLTPIS
jgi:hypothetical protein